MSTLQTKIVRLGDSATLANNFELVVPAVPDGTFKIRRQDGTEILSVDAAGKVNIPNTQAVLISASSNSQTIPTGLGTSHAFTWPAPLVNIAGAFDTTTGFWVPTIAGYYQINASVSYANAGLTASNVNCNIVKNANAIAIGSQSSNSGGFPAPSISTITFLNGTTDGIRVVTNHNAAGSIANVIGQISACLLSKA